ncbi:uncharacterized protein LOC119668072 [Teleopsis dalmanni]|uniref:uncharacterized protein LOC119665905 n=1 Tax=Teleopsis dalmanni TaxID=139649 RepID=UPI0018CF7384|nr:uncharacterized protein LOC119665905 [Teleopsis dalmanni]XP_037933383.1 uncharacterized protein LOC119668072 [Teleopsis dalmanni]
MYRKLVNIAGYNSLNSLNSLCKIQNHHNAFVFRHFSEQNFNLLQGPSLQFNFVRPMHNWKSQMDLNDQRRKVIPKLVYLHNPWKYLLTKFNLWKLRLFWDRDFVEQEFIEGSKQAAIVITDIIRDQQTSRIGQFTTPIGFQQITRDMLLSRNDTRLKLIKFSPEHLRKAIPMKVSTRKNFGHKFCFIDMLFVGLRNTKDFGSAEEVVEVKEVLRKLDADMHTPQDIQSVPHRIVFAEIFMRFRRDYTETALTQHETRKDDWSVSFYKILSFDILNYDPKA